MSYRNGATPTNEAPQIYNTYHRSRPTSGTSRSNFPSQHYQYSHRPSNSQRVNGHSQRPSSAGVTRDHSSSGYSRNNSNTNTGDPRTKLSQQQTNHQFSVTSRSPCAPLREGITQMEIQ